MDIVFIGAGNVAFHLSKSLHDAGFTIVQIFSRTEASAKKLANVLNTAYTNKIDNITDNASVYIMSVSDNAIEGISERLTMLNGLVVHTAGGVSIDVFKEKIKNYGVLYPLQTFSKSRPVSFSEIPLFIEANSRENLQIISKIAGAISQKVHFASSEERRQLHLAAVFACNFVNHLYNISAQLARQARFDFTILEPLILETAHKALASENPADVQTGPAVRNDSEVMKKHKDLLSSLPEWKKIYEILSENIMR